MHAKRRNASSDKHPPHPRLQDAPPRVTVKVDLCDKQSLIRVQHVCWVHPVSQTRNAVFAQGLSRYIKMQNELPEGPRYNSVSARLQRECVIESYNAWSSTKFQNVAAHTQGFYVISVAFQHLNRVPLSILIPKVAFVKLVGAGDGTGSTVCYWQDSNVCPTFHEDHQSILIFQ